MPGRSHDVARRSGRTREALMAFAFLAPVLVIFGAFSYYPLYRLVYLSLFQRNDNKFLAVPDRWIGWRNIADTLGGEPFLSGLWVSMRFTDGCS